MKNLKKVLSLVLALAMALSLMTVAFAKEAGDYTDYDEITNKEAVEVLTALEVIDGMGDSFQPNGNVTRAQMAKMITIISLGNVDPTAFLGTATDLTDINGHWAEAYIKYCYSQGIISGRGNGIFDPNANVTSAEAAKMLLTAIGYNSNVQGYTGPQWAINVTRDAQISGFYEGVSVPANQALTRDEAAQMIWNAVQATMIQKTSSVDRVDGTITDSYRPYDDGRDLLSETFDAVVRYGYMSDAEYDEVRGEYTYTFSNAAAGSFGAAYIQEPNNDHPDAQGMADGFDLTTDADVSGLYGQQVKAIYKTDVNNTVYGIYSANSEVLVSGVVGALPDDLEAGDTSMKLDGVTYRFNVRTGANTTSNTAADVGIYDVLNTTDPVNGIDDLETKTAAGNPRAEWAFDLIDNDNDGRANCMVVYPVTVEKVTYVGKESITLDSSIGSKDLEDDINVYDGIAKDDYVARTAATYTVDGKESVVKLSTVTGVVSAIRDTNEVQIDGTWYKYSNLYAGGTALNAANNVGDTVILQVLNGFYVDSEVTLADGSANILYISAADPDTTSLGAQTVKAKAYFSDGTYKTIIIDKVNDTATPTSSAMSDNTNKPDTADYLTNNAIVVEGMMYRYTVDADGNYELYALADDTAVHRANYDKYSMDNTGSIEYATTTNRLTVGGTSYSVPDDAVVYAQTTVDSNTADGDSRSTRVITGKALKNWNWTTLNGNADSGNITVQVLSTTVNGVATARVITFVNATNAAAISGADTTLYGYVTAVPAIINNPDGVRSQQFVIWNGTESITVFQDGTSSTVAKGDFVSYENEGEGEITSLTALGKAYAVTGLSDNDTVLDLIDEAGATVEAAKVDADDTTVIYVNTKDVVGVAGGAFTLANEPADGQYEMNVWTVSKGDGEVLDIIFVDTNNVISGTSTVMTATGAVPAGADSNDIKDLDDGLYVPVDVDFITDPDAKDHTPANLLIFKFASVADTQGVTLKITNAANADIYTETHASDITDGDHYFTVDGSGYMNNGGTSGSLNGDHGTGLDAGTTYYYTVTGTVDGVLLTGSFVYSGN